MSLSSGGLAYPDRFNHQSNTLYEEHAGIIPVGKTATGRHVSAHVSNDEQRDSLVAGKPAPAAELRPLH